MFFLRKKKNNNKEDDSPTLHTPSLPTVPRKISKKRKIAEGGARKLVQPIPLDSTGRPVFPIVLGGLTVYSLGEVRA